MKAPRPKRAHQPVDHKAEAYGKLLAAEADFLHAYNWSPYSLHGLVSWSDPVSKKMLQQGAAVAAQKTRLLCKSSQV